MISHAVTVAIPSIPPRIAMLSRAVASVLTQTYPASAISIAVDHDRRGAAANRNKALHTVQTEWVAFLDDDDEMYPHHIAALVQHQETTGADIVFPWFDTSGGADPFPQFEGRQYNHSEPHMFPITTLVRTEFAIAVGGFPTSLTNEECAGEDWQFWLKLRDLGATFAHLNSRTWLWHHHGENTSGLPSRW